MSISDAAGATTYWWLSTLNVLQGALGGSAGSAGVTVTVVDSKGRSVPAVSNAKAVPASYNNGVFTPPALTGNFAVPSTVTGPVTVHVTLTAALDGIPLTNTASASLFVNNPPTTTVVLPSNGASVAGSTNLDALASDYGTLTKVEFHLTGGSLNEALVATATPTIYGWLAGWNTTTIPNGTYVLQSEAYDVAGLSAYSNGVTLTVNNPPPSTTVVIPSGGSTVKGNAVSLDASASSGVSQVQIRAHGRITDGLGHRDRDPDLLRLVGSMELARRPRRHIHVAKRGLLCRRGFWRESGRDGHGGKLMDFGGAATGSPRPTAASSRTATPPSRGRPATSSCTSRSSAPPPSASRRRASQELFDESPRTREFMLWQPGCGPMPFLPSRPRTVPRSRRADVT